MARKGKRTQECNKLVDKTKFYTVDEAVAILAKAPAPKFDQSIDLAVRMGVDPRKSDQAVRGTVSLPHGTGKKSTIVVLCQGDRVKEALAAGASFAGSDELIEKIKGGWTDFTALIATPDMMREVGKLGKILGPRGLMPSPKAGTVTNEVGKAVTEVLKGKIEFKLDRFSIISNSFGKLSFTADSLKDNLKALVGAIVRAKPAAAKGQYIKAVTLSSTMGPGLKIDLRELEVA